MTDFLKIIYLINGIFFSLLSIILVNINHFIGPLSAIVLLLPATHYLIKYMRYDSSVIKEVDKK